MDKKSHFHFLRTFDGCTEKIFSYVERVTLDVCRHYRGARFSGLLAIPRLSIEACCQALSNPFVPG